MELPSYLRLLLLLDHCYYSDDRYLHSHLSQVVPLWNRLRDVHWLPAVAALPKATTLRQMQIPERAVWVEEG